jgi:orotate phosphoribosyltransferase
MKKFVEGISNPAGMPVVILDDVCTTGGSTVAAIERARLAGMNVLGAVCLVDREMGGEKSIQEDLGCPFERIFRLSELV